MIKNERTLPQTLLKIQAHCYRNVFKLKNNNLRFGFSELANEENNISYDTSILINTSCQIFEEVLKFEGKFEENLKFESMLNFEQNVKQNHLFIS